MILHVAFLSGGSWWVIRKRIEWDHKHQKDIIKLYEFESAGQLIEDFWNDVNHMVTNAYVE